MLILSNVEFDICSLYCRRFYYRRHIFIFAFNIVDDFIIDVTFLFSHLILLTILLSTLIQINTQRIKFIVSHIIVDMMSSLFNY